MSRIKHVVRVKKRFERDLYAYTLYMYILHVQHANVYYVIELGE